MYVNTLIFEIEETGTTLTVDYNREEGQQETFDEPGYPESVDYGRIIDQDGKKIFPCAQTMKDIEREIWQKVNQEKYDYLHSY